MFDPRHSSNRCACASAFLVASRVLFLKVSSLNKTFKNLQGCLTVQLSKSSVPLGGDLNTLTSTSFFVNSFFYFFCFLFSTSYPRPYPRFYPQSRRAFDPLLYCDVRIASLLRSSRNPAAIRAPLICIRKSLRTHVHRVNTPVILRQASLPRIQGF